MESIARYVIRHRRSVLGIWALLAIFGAFGAGQAEQRYREDFSNPGHEAHEANQRALARFGTGAQPPLVAVFRSSGDITRVPGIERAVAAAAATIPGSRTSSYFSTDRDVYVSRDRRTTFAAIYPPGNPTLDPRPGVTERARAALEAAAPAGVTVHLTGRDALEVAAGNASSPSVLVEALVGAAGAVLILLLVFRTLPAVAIPLAVAAASILTTFGALWLLTFALDVSLVVQYLVALVGLGVAIDYSLLMIFRFREELGRGCAVEEAVVGTMRRAGRALVVSGATVGVGLLSLLVMPVPLLRSIGLGGALIPLVTVLAGITLLPALLVVLGRRIDRLRVMPRRTAGDGAVESALWRRWAELVLRRPLPAAAAGLGIVALLLVPALQLNPSEPQAGSLPGAGDAVAGRDALAAAGMPLGVFKPLVVLVEEVGQPAELDTVVSALERTPGIAGAAAPPDWRSGDAALVEAFPAADSSSRTAEALVEKLRGQVLPAVEDELDGGTKTALGGVAAEERELVDALYGSFPAVLGVVVLLTFVLLVRAFRSLLLPIKAVLLNLVSLGAAFGIVVLVFQQGHGSEAIWGIEATDSIVPWVPLMMFAFLYGLSMDYEVFMLARIREAYDEQGDTARAIASGLARTGKLVTSAALVLMFALFALSTSPGPELKQFAIGLAAGIIFDATVIRALLVPALMQLMGRWNWWLPAPVHRVLVARRGAT
jgi:RND superfamily putative drug exporter